MYKRDNVLTLLYGIGCMSDVRLNGAPLPLDRTEVDSDGSSAPVAEVSARSQNVRDGCESNACVGVLCQPGLVCHDVWRLAECRFTISLSSVT